MKAGSTSGGTLRHRGAPRSTGQGFRVSLQNTNQLIVSGWSDDAVFTLPLPSYADGAWHHVVASYVGSTKTVTVYLDGVAVGSPQVLTDGVEHGVEQQRARDRP